MLESYDPNNPHRKRSDIMMQSMPSSDVYRQDRMREGAVSAFNTKGYSPIHKLNKSRKPVHDFLDAAARQKEQEAKANEKKLRLPLLKGADDLDQMLSDMIGPEELQRIRNKQRT